MTVSKCNMGGSIQNMTNKMRFKHLSHSPEFLSGYATSETYLDIYYMESRHIIMHPFHDSWPNYAVEKTLYSSKITIAYFNRILYFHKHDAQQHRTSSSKASVPLLPSPERRPSPHIVAIMSLVVRRLLCPNFQ